MTCLSNLTKVKLHTNLYDYERISICSHWKLKMTYMYLMFILNKCKYKTVKVHLELIQ